MKKLVLTALILTTLTGSAYASPLMDYSQGKFGLDLTYRPNPDIDVDDGYAELSLDGKANEFGVTAGLGSNFALQYRQTRPKGDASTIGPNAWYGDPYLYQEDFNGKLKAQEFNIMYKVNKNVAVFTGIVDGDASGSIVGTCVHPDPAGNHPLGRNLTFTADNRVWQVGVVGVTKLSDKSNLFGVASLGNDYRNIEAGISYALTKELEVDISYRNMKLKDLDVTIAGSSATGEKLDANEKGFGFGITYKF